MGVGHNPLGGQVARPQQDTHTKKHADLKREEAHTELLIQAHGRQQSEHADLAIRTFELSQTLMEEWVSADIAEKRTILEIICSNWTLDVVTPVPTMRKPFDVLAEGLISKAGRPDRTRVKLFVTATSCLQHHVQQLIRAA